MRVMQERPRPDPATFLGSGKIEGLAASCAAADVDDVIFDVHFVFVPADLQRKGAGPAPAAVWRSAIWMAPMT